MPDRSSIRVRSCAYLVCLLATAAPLSYAAAAPKAQGSPETKRAAEAYQEGQVAFNLGQWDKAIEAWQRGYALKQDSVFLYNIAQAYRKEGDLEHAIFFYKSYLRNSSTAPNRDEVTGWIDQLEKEQAEQKQKEADEAAAAQKRADEERRAREEAAARAAAEAVPAPPPKAPRELNGDVGVAVGANLWLAGLHDGAGLKPSAAVELSGGYTLVHAGRISFRLGGTVGFTYLPDLHSTVNFLGVMVDPTVKVDLWRHKLFFFGQVGLGVGIMTGTKSNQPTYVTDSPMRAANGTFAMFEVRPAVGLAYRIVPRLSVLLAPGVVVTPKYADHMSTQVRFQILAGIQVHL